MTAMQDHEVQGARFDLSLIAPAGVVHQAEEASTRFAEWRDVVGTGSRQGDEAFQNAWAAYRASRDSLPRIMRSTLDAD